jgi:two-component system, chemotaxis family, protein-glutamate methylesterase/glutaminase
LSIRVLVVDDSLTVRRRLVEVLSRDPGIEVVGEAADGLQAIEACRRLSPDVVTLDIVMPVMDGVAATEHIMAFLPRPVVVISAAQNRGEVFHTFDALRAGAVEVVEKPPADEAENARWERTLVSTVKVASRIKVITHLRGKYPSRLAASVSEAATHLTPPIVVPDRPRPRLVALGASTGGPQALVQVLRSLPREYGLPVLVVLHISDSFGEPFADWLDSQVPLPVRLVRQELPLPQPGSPGVWVAGPGRHLVVRGDRLTLDAGAERHALRPSVDVLFESLLQDDPRCVVAGVLTGMGRDGAEGLLQLRKAGAFTFAQDEATSVVFGMPREAALLGGAEKVLPLGRIADELLMHAALPCGENT